MQPSPPYSYGLRTESGMGKKDTGALDPQLDKQKSYASKMSSAVILVVEGDPSQRFVVQAILSDKG